MFYGNKFMLTSQLLPMSVERFMLWDKSLKDITIFYFALINLF